MSCFGPAAFRSIWRLGRQHGRIGAFGAVRADTGERLVHSGAVLAEALLKLDELADGASFVLGHNLIGFDLPHLAAAKPELRLLRLPAVDTLRLSPLAFPRHPYHHLVKHYQDGGLKRGRVNDPELDARLALEVFGDQRRALKRAPPDLLAAWHWLCTPKPEGADRALDELLRGGPPIVPSFGERGAGSDRPAPGRRGLCESRPGDIGEAEGVRLAAGVCAGMALGGGRQFCHAALGAPSVPGGRTPRAPPQGPRLCRSPVRLVSRAARCPQGVEALVRFRRVSTRT